MTKVSKELVAQCQAYLETGPPEHMTNYVPDSLTEIVIAYGARSEELDAELQEIAAMIINEPMGEIEDPEIKKK